MAIKLICSCGKQLSVPDNMAGKKGKCPGCGQTLQVPEAKGAAETQPRRVYKGPDLNVMPLIMTIVVILLLLATGAILFLKKSKSPEGVCDRAIADMEARNYADAEAKLKKLIETSPNSVEGHTTLGRLYFDIEKYDEALAEYTKVLELKPNDAQAQERIGAVYLRQGNLKKAYEVQKKLKTMDEKLAQVLLDAIHVLDPPPPETQPEAPHTGDEKKPSGAK